MKPIWMAGRSGSGGGEMMGPYLREGPQRLTETEVFDAWGSPAVRPGRGSWRWWRHWNCGAGICADAVDIQAFGSLVCRRATSFWRMDIVRGAVAARAGETRHGGRVPDEANRPDTLDGVVELRRDAAADLGLSAPLQGSPERPGWLLRGVAECWTHGIDIDWEALPVADAAAGWTSPAIR